MVNNYDRIFVEIHKESARIEEEQGTSADMLVDLVLDIVDLEDQHRVKRSAINKNVENAIVQAARMHAKNVSANSRENSQRHSHEDSWQENRDENRTGVL